ncbi:hypothetical protein PENFLA_c010G01449 [Penicillium flavigenum]|uniref:Amidase domain-containing protein n=1 Tax=Penicillium flavigenum TaxID=254877 RepID=A0A1V6TD39_9EURO|nr:hypothetical protein PENFLA_c010G01449 [Penicillium flavigenum]
MTENPLATPIHVLSSCGLLSVSELNWTDPSKHDATSLLHRLATSEVSSTHLVTAFCKRAAIAHQLTNCLTEILFKEAIARAKALDEHLQRTKEVIGPLHGIPITFKNSFDIKGHDASSGITALCFSPSQRNSLLYDILTGEFGVAGSTGGEGALLALGGSVLGIGTDGAGSVRMPAAVNGVVGYKPSGYRLPLDGRRIMGTGVMGTTAFGPVSVTGFLGRSVQDVALFTKLSAEAKPWEKDPFIYPHPWQSLSLQKAQRVRIGVWSSNDFVHLHPPVERGFKAAQESLRNAGVELVEFHGPDISQAWEMHKEWTELQDLSYLRELLSKEPHTEIVKATEIITKKAPCPPPTIAYIHSMNARISALVRAMHDSWGRVREPIDALLWVPAPHTAVPFDKYTYLGFTGLFNIIDWPAVALPLGMFVDKEIDRKVQVTPFNAHDADLQDMYDADSFHGLPLEVQLIGRRFEDEKLLAVSEVVHALIKQTSFDVKL